jgi:hypothetical protein
VDRVHRARRALVGPVPQGRPTQAGIDWAMDTYAAEHISASLRKHPSNGEPTLFDA